MKEVFVFVFLFIFIKSSISDNPFSVQTVLMDHYCFSEANFDRVYKFLKMQIRNSNNREYYIFDSYEFHLVDSAKIAVKDKGYTLALIDKTRGIYSLAKVLEDNKNLTKKANEMFCDLLDIIEK